MTQLDGWQTVSVIIGIIVALLALLRSYLPPRHVVEASKARIASGPSCESSQHANRIHDRMDRLSDAMTEQTINVNKMASSVESMVKAIDRRATDSENLHRDTIARIDNLNKTVSRVQETTREDHGNINKNIERAIKAFEAQGGRLA